MTSPRINKSDLLGVAAGLAVILVGVIGIRLFFDPCNVGERSSYVGGVQVPAEIVKESDNPVVLNPYGLETCDYWPSKPSQWIGFVGVVFIYVVGFVTAMRIGEKRSALRGIVSVVLAFVILSVLISQRVIG